MRTIIAGLMIALLLLVGCSSQLPSSSYNSASSFEAELHQADWVAACREDTIQLVKSTPGYPEFAPPLSQFVIGWSDFQCSESGYGGNQVLKAKINYNGEEALISYSGGGRGSGGWSTDHTILIIPDSSNQFYQLLHQHYPKFEHKINGATIFDFYKRDHSHLSDKEITIKSKEVVLFEK